VIFCTLGLDSDQQYVLPLLIRSSAGETLPEFVNLTKKTVFTNAILPLEAAIYKQGEHLLKSQPRVCFMSEEHAGARRRTFRWPKEARELVRIHLNVRSEKLREQNPDNVILLITKLAEVSGNPRDACWRFARQLGVSGKRSYRGWPERAQQRLLDLISIQPLPEVAIAMRRSPGSIRSMLHRLGASARMGQDWFTKYTLAEALHIRADEVQRWISLGWLKCRLVHTGKLQREIIEADDFAEFCKTHSREVWAAD